jgi:hypothetical protein
MHINGPVNNIVTKFIVLPDLTVQTETIEGNLLRASFVGCIL